MNNKPSKIPKFKSIEEEARFWDEHDIGDFMDEMKIVKGVYEPTSEVKTTMTLRVSPTLKARVEAVARNFDLSVSSLVRMWMTENVKKASDLTAK